MLSHNREIAKNKKSKGSARKIFGCIINPGHGKTCSGF